MRECKYIYWFLIVIFLLFVFWFSILKNNRETRLIKEGNIIVKKIEVFISENKRLPSSLEEIGIKEQIGINALYYDKKDSTHYIVWFGMSLGESKTYYSDSKKWEDFDR